jgi:GT2 family glycosyltransferase
MSISVVIPTWRRADLLRRCLAGVLEQQPAPEEVIVVGRATDPDARGVVDSARTPSETALSWIEVGTPGHVPPVQAGLDATKSELVAFIDDDAVPEPGWLAELQRVMHDSTIACAGGYVHTPGSRPIVRRDSGTIRWYGKHIGNIASVVADAPLEVDSVMEGNWCWRTSVMRTLVFEPVFHADSSSMYGLDLTLQAKQMGGKVVYTSAARVVHTPGPRYDGSMDRSDRHRAFRSYSRNYTFIALRRFRGIRRTAFVFWWWLVGERGSYGLATGIVDWLIGRVRSGDIRASFNGKTEGVGAWLRSR